ncbi:DUF5959 family protein [Streptomyces cyaneofuscatus]
MCNETRLLVVAVVFSTHRREGNHGGSSPTHLISLADGEGISVTVSILGRNVTWTAGLDAEIVVSTPFVSGRLDLPLSVRDLNAWSAAHHRRLRRVMDHWVPMLTG